MPRFSVVNPTTIEHVVEALQQPGARLVAGGTDLLPNLKHQLEHPRVLVSLAGVEALRTIVVGSDVLRIGAGVTLSELANHPEIQRQAPSLADAAGRVASPLIRNAGTIGGNINLDTRCRYVNQTAFWRSAIGGCLKSEGDVCHVVPGGRNCVAALSSDLVPVLIALEAELVLAGPEGQRELALEHFYRADGLRHTMRRDDELVTEVRVPVPSAPRHCQYVKWTVRQSIDFPLVSVAVRFDLDPDAERVSEVKVVVGVLGSRPRVVTRLDGMGGRLLTDPELADEIAERVYRQCKPLENVPYEADYRRRMLRVHTRRAISALVAGATPQFSAQ